MWNKIVKQEIRVVPGTKSQAYKRDIPSAEVHLLDTGHFALETHATEISELIHQFLKKILITN